MLSAKQIKNLEEKWNGICTRCYKENEEYKENKIACGTYFPGQPISKFFLDGKQQEECDLFNCTKCNKIKDGNQGHQWFFESGIDYRNGNLKWTKYSANTNAQIETAYKNGKNWVSLNKDWFSANPDYVVQFNTSEGMVEGNRKTWKMGSNRLLFPTRSLKRDALKVKREAKQLGDAKEECCNAKGICKINNFKKCQKKPVQSMKVNFKDYVLKCGIVYIGIFLPLDKRSMDLDEVALRKYKQTFDEIPVYVQNYYKFTLSDNQNNVDVELITDKKKYFGVRCINIEYGALFSSSRDEITNFFGNITSEMVEVVVTLYPSITNISEKVGDADDNIGGGEARHYFFTMIKPTDDYAFPPIYRENGELKQLQHKKSWGVVGADAQFDTEPGNHTTEDIDRKIKEQENIYVGVSEEKEEKEEKEEEEQNIPDQLWSGAKQSTINKFENFINLLYPRALNFFKYRIYIDPCGQGVCAAIAYNLFFLSTKLYRNKPFTFTEKAFITLIFIFHNYPTNKRGPYRKGWQISKLPAMSDEKNTSVLIPERTKGCTNCELNYDFEYHIEDKMNACDRGCETRVTKIFDQIHHDPQKDYRRTIEALCCDRGLKKGGGGGCPRKGKCELDNSEESLSNSCKNLTEEEDCLKEVPKCKWREDRQNSFLRRNFYYYIYQVFRQLVTPLKDNELHDLIFKKDEEGNSFFPASWNEGWKEMQEKSIGESPREPKFFKRGGAWPWWKEEESLRKEEAERERLEKAERYRLGKAEREQQQQQDAHPWWDPDHGLVDNEIDINDWGDDDDWD